jgi:hypothetical protein
MTVFQGAVDATFAAFRPGRLVWNLACLEIYDPLFLTNRVEATHYSPSVI